MTMYLNAIKPLIRKQAQIVKERNVENENSF
jgi:hypothetical protein